MWLETGLALWSTAGLAWMALAWSRLRRLRDREPADAPPESPAPLTAFRSLPPGRPFAEFRDPLTTLSTQLGPHDVLLLGFRKEHETGVAAWTAQQSVRILPIALDTVAGAGNPKIAAYRSMAARASGGPDLWFWSDADITCPPGHLDRLRSAWAARGSARALTCAYLIPEIRSAPALADAAFVNLHLLPGLLLLGRQPLDFAVGAGTLFHRDDFQARCDWDALAGTLADDHVLGKRLAPVALLQAPCATTAEDASWTAAWTHLLRWQSTIHRCNPPGSAAQLATLPLIGWTLAAACFPGTWTLAGLVLWVVAETCWAAACFRLLRCRLAPSAAAGLPLVPFLRNAAWLLAWLPLTISWGNSRWRGLAAAGARPSRSWRTLLAGTAPWAAWWALAPWQDQPWRGLGALAVWWITQALERLTLKAVDAVFALYFLALALHPALPPWTVHALLATMALASLGCGRPFTLAYARESTSPDEWTEPGFLPANRLLTALWACAFLANTAATAAFPAPWPLPAWCWVMLHLGLAALFTKLIPRWYRSTSLPAPATESGARLP